jgi:DNA-binding transcriptional ArsR family regulator
VNPKRDPGLPLEFLDRMAERLKVLAHPHRLKMVEILEIRQEAPVHELMDRAALPQATASHHLNVMRRAGLIRAERRGKEIWYRIADPDSLTILACIRKKRGVEA